MRAALLLLLLLVPVAGAMPLQQTDACRPPFLAVEQPRGPFEPGVARTLLLSIENPNRAPVETVRATVTTTTPAGWAAVPQHTDFAVAPLDPVLSTLAVTPPNRGSGAREGNITLIVTFVCTGGSVQSSATAFEVLPVELESFQPPWPLVLGTFAVLAGGVGVLALRRLQRGLALVVATPDRDIEPGKTAKFTFNVENRRGKPQQLKLEAEPLPEGWTLHLALVDVALEPGEEKALWAILRAPPHARPGDHVSAKIHLRANARDVASGTLHARVIGT